MNKESIPSDRPVPRWELKALIPLNVYSQADCFLSDKVEQKNWILNNITSIEK